jgi:hypothetical protein
MFGKISFFLLYIVSHRFFPENFNFFFNLLSSKNKHFLSIQEIGICTERQIQPHQQFQQVPPPPAKRQFFTERGTSPAPMMMVEKEEEDFNASLGRLIQFTSIGVDTRDLLPQDEGHITKEEHLFYGEILGILP